MTLHRRLTAAETTQVLFGTISPHYLVVRLCDDELKQLSSQKGHFTSQETGVV